MSFFSKIKQILNQVINIPVKEKDQNTNQNLPDNKILLTIKNPKSMSMFNYGVGGNEVKVDANEAIQEIQENKTLIVSKLTENEPINPEIITGLKTVEEVFKYFKPSIEVDQETAEGATVKEDFRFATLADFTPKNITNQSPFLKNLHLQQEQYNKIVRQLKANKVLKSMLDDEQSRKAFVAALKAVAQELESHN